MLASISPEAAAALSVITSSQWMVLQGYLASLVPTWGEVVYSQFLSSGGGGLIVTKPISTWLYGELTLLASLQFSC